VSAGRLNERDIFFCRAIANFLKGLCLAIIELRVDFVVTRAVLVALKRGWNRRAQVLDQTLHFLAELLRLTRWEPNGMGFVWQLKVMNITPVRRDFLRRRAPVEKPPNDGVFTHASGAHREEVISLASDPDAKLDCINRSWLANDLR